MSDGIKHCQKHRVQILHKTQTFTLLKTQRTRHYKKHKAQALQKILRTDIPKNAETVRKCKHSHYKKRKGLDTTENTEGKHCRKH